MEERKNNSPTNQTIGRYSDDPEDHLQGQKKYDLDIIIDQHNEIIELKNDVFIEKALTTFNYITNLKTHLIFKKVDAKNENQKSFISIEGEIGSGKSTTSSTLMYLHCQATNTDHRQKLFRFGRQSERVTTSCTTKSVEKLSIMDTPGTNDF